MDSFIPFIKKYVTISASAQQDITNLLQTERLKKGEFLLEEGQYCNRLYFISKGAVRTFFYHKGKEVTYWIYPQNTLVTSWSSYVFKKPSIEYIETLEDSSVISLTYDQWQKLYSKHRELESFGRLVMEESVGLLDDFYKGYYFMSAKEKYELLLNVFPRITQIANLGHIASMLGISQETLSRIRGQ